jgi:sporulation protein YlmC with PRC-barrel domain
MTILSTSTIVGTEVRSPRAEDLGEIKDLMIDLTSGCVAYAVVEFGGLLGIGSKLFAVPLPAMKQDAMNKCFILDTDKEALENAPGFDKNKWPDFADRMWQTAMHDHYKETPYWD